MSEIKQQAGWNLDDILEIKPNTLQRSYSKYLAETNANVGYTEQVKPKVSKWETFKSEIEAEPEIKQIEAVLAVNFGVANVLYETGKSLLHPIDNIVKPLGSLVWDTGLLAFGADYDYQAAQRMAIRWQGLKQGTREFYQDISSNDVWRSHYAMGELLGSGLTLFAGGEGVTTALGNLAKISGRLSLGRRLFSLDSRDGLGVNLFRTGSEGIEPASKELIQAIESKGRTILYAREFGTSEEREAYRFLQYFNAEANAGGPLNSHIILKDNPSKAAVLEEFLHGTQAKLGIIDKLGQQGAEVHVKEFIIRHQSLLGLGEEDIKILQQLLNRDRLQLEAENYMKKGPML